MQELLIRLLVAVDIKHETRNGSVHVAERFEDALMSLFDAVRDIRFESWHSFRPLNPSKADAYRKQGKVEIATALTISAESGRLEDRLTFIGLMGTKSNNFRQITPGLTIETSTTQLTLIVLRKAEHGL